MRAAVFADILGVAGATERYFDSSAISTYADTDWVSRLNLFRNRPLSISEGNTEKYLWLRTVVLLPLLVAESLVLLKEIDGKSHIHCALFSDSAFVVFEGPEDALHFSSYLLACAFRRLIPLRIGLGFGSFTHFSTDDLQALSETLPFQHLAESISRDFTRETALNTEKEMWKFVRSHLRVPGPDLFIGASITRAFKAESCGLKGMRILVHDSFASALPEAFRLYLCPILRSELKKRKRAANYVRFEVCWPMSLFYWKDRSITPVPSSPVPFSGFRIKSNFADSLVGTLEHYYDPDHTAPEHYHFTWNSIVGMRDHMASLGLSRNIPFDPLKR